MGHDLHPLPKLVVVSGGGPEYRLLSVRPQGPFGRGTVSHSSHVVGALDPPPGPRGRTGVPGTSWLCPGAALNDLAQPFLRCGKGSESGPQRG